MTRQSGRLAATPDYGSWLLGKVNREPARRRVRIQVILTFFILFTNLIGIVVATCWSRSSFPVPSVFTDVPAWLTFVVAPAYIGLALATGHLLGHPTDRQVAAVGDRGADTRLATDQRNTFVAPWRVARMVLVLWGVGTALLTDAVRTA